MTNEAYTSKDLNKTYSDMLVYRFKCAEEAYTKTQLGEGMALSKLRSCTQSSGTLLVLRTSEKKVAVWRYQSRSSIL